MIGNQRGQAAIFVALLFNVLFIFFAMAINVALVVHDKINLQNSVDLASYYAASKQAEILNAIAHENYMIRQSYKLLAWRYRVLGTMGIIVGDRHPAWTGDLSDSAWSGSVAPSTCIVYKPTWEEVPEGENLCRERQLKIPPLPEVKVIAGFLGLNHGIAALSRTLRYQFLQQCNQMVAHNWWFAASILHAFRLDQRNRKLVIQALAKNLSAGQNGDFLDLDGNSVMEGARQTFIKNLTYANRESFEASGGQLSMMNSLEGVDQREWLPEIKIIPTLIYTDVTEEEGCFANPQAIANLPARSAIRDILNKPYPEGLDSSELMTWSQTSFLSDSDFQFSIGVEKNPWYMAYIGIKAKTSPRQIFFPFGSGIEMVARAFAKPFGGRIGPWYQSKWERGAKNSDGDLVDPLMAPRMEAGGIMNSPSDPRRLPNYSRYPGDKLGLASKLALNGVNGLNALKAAFDSYKNIKADIDATNANDILAWDNQGNKSPTIREFEIAAIAPDLFDITYYSIEPDFTKNYLERLEANKAKLGIPFEVPVRPDLGHHGTEIKTFTIQEQMDLAHDKGRQRADAYYFVRQKAHLLTAWLPGSGAFNYDVNDSLENFGKCALPDDKLKYPNPGSCVAGGGRTGYSVKLVGRDALLSSKHKIGGNAGEGAIMNPPKDADGW